MSNQQLNPNNIDGPLVLDKYGFVTFLSGTDGKEHVYRSDQAYVHPRVPARFETYTTSINGAFVPNNQFIEFLIPGQGLEEMDNLVLRWSVTETLTSATLVAPAFFQIQRIEYLPNSESTPKSTSYDITHLLNHGLLTSEQFQMVSAGNQLGVSTSWAQNVTLNNSTNWFQMNIIGSVLEKLRFRAFGQNGLKIRVWLPSTIIQSGAGSLSMNNFYMLGISEAVLDASAINYTRILQKYPLNIRFVEPLIIQISGVILTAGVANTINQMNAMKGNFTHIVLYARAGLTNTAAASMTFLQLEGSSQGFQGLITMKNGSGQPIFTPGGWAPWELRYQEYFRNFQGVQTFYLPLYYIVFADNPAAAITQGQMDGFATFRGTEQITIQPGTGLAGSGGAFYVELHCYVVSEWEINNGVVTYRAT